MPPESYIKVPLPLSLVLSLPFVSPLALARAQPLPEAILHFWMAKAGKKESQLWVVKRRKAEQIQSELLYRLCCKCTPSTWWSGYLGKAVRILVFCKQMKGLASGDVMLLPPLKATFSNPGFPTGCRKQVPRVVCGRAGCRTPVPGLWSPPAPLLFPVPDKNHSCKWLQ